MKNITLALFAAATFATSTLAYADSAMEISRVDASMLQKVGVVSAGGFTNLDELNTSLSMKASEAGATHYRIVSASGNNKLSGTAVLYR